MGVTNYRELIAWQKAMGFAVALYTATEPLPKAEAYRLTDQLRRAAISIPSNIAEGQGRRSTREFLKHLGYANGSLYEAETQIELGFRIGQLLEDVYRQLMDQAAGIGRILNGLMAALERRLEAEESQ
jgi:four helix bundle protein